MTSMTSEYCFLVASLSTTTARDSARSIRQQTTRTDVSSLSTCARDTLCAIAELGASSGSKSDVPLHLVMAVVLRARSVCGLSRSLQRKTSRIPVNCLVLLIICMHWSSVQLQSSATFPHAADSQHAIMQALKIRTGRLPSERMRQPGYAGRCVQGLRSHHW
jgi:hypothetical protein